MKYTKKDEAEFKQGYRRRTLPPKDDDKAVSISARHLRHTIEYNKTHRDDHDQDIERAESSLKKLAKHVGRKV